MNSLSLRHVFFILLGSFSSLALGSQKSQTLTNYIEDQDRKIKAQDTIIKDLQKSSIKSDNDGVFGSYIPSLSTIKTVISITAAAYSLYQGYRYLDPYTKKKANENSKELQEKINNNTSEHKKVLKNASKKTKIVLTNFMQKIEHNENTVFLQIANDINNNNNNLNTVSDSLNNVLISISNDNNLIKANIDINDEALNEIKKDNEHRLQNIKIINNEIDTVKKSLNNKIKNYKNKSESAIKEIEKKLLKSNNLFN